MHLLENIFSIKNSPDKRHKIITFFFLQLKIKRKELTIEAIKKIADNNKIEIIQGVQNSIAAALLHQKTFSSYKNKHNNKEVVLIGAGPTLSYFKPFTDKKVYVGCNRAFIYNDIQFDYLFTIDKAGLDNGYENYYKEFFTYREGACVKFVGDQNLGKNYQIPESEILKYNVSRYKTTSGYLPNKLHVDIDSYPLANYATVSLQALQFILYTNPSKIYIVGIDCTTSTGKHFTGFDYDATKRSKGAAKNDENNIKAYKEIKEFIQIYYPETEIVSINPVGLRGIFRDVYTQEYIDANPEIRMKLGEKIEII